MADAAECSDRTIKNGRRNLQLFGKVHAPSNQVGRRRTIRPPILDALCDHLLATTSSIRRALIVTGWSKKSICQRAKDQNAELRELYLHNISEFESYHLVYVDESCCDKRIGLRRRTGWSPLGVAPVQVSQFHRDERYQILPAYAQDGVVLLAFFAAPQMPLCSRISSTSFFGTVEVARAENRPGHG